MSVTDPSTWRLETIAGVKYRLVERFGEYSNRNSTATEVFIISSNQLTLFVNDIFPVPEIVNGVAIRNNRLMPGTALRAKSFRWASFVEGLPIDPFDTDDVAPLGTYKDILQVTVTYDDEFSEQNPNVPESFLTITGNVSGEFLYVQADEAVYDSDQGQTTNKYTTPPASVFVPTIDWSLRWDHIPRNYFEVVLIPLLRAANGKVNSIAFDPLFSAPPETLLLNGYNFEEEFFTLQLGQILRQPPVSLQVNMIEKNVDDVDDKVAGHNHRWDPERGWRRFLFDGTNPPYKSYDFNIIFQPIVNQALLPFQ